jgi:hypothetical protein
MFGRITRKRALTAIAALVVLAVAGSAFAYFTTSGEGKGSATVGTSEKVTITQLGSTSGLEPGGEAQPVNFTITNPQTTKQFVSKVEIEISEVTGPNLNPPSEPCTKADFKLTQPSVIDQDLSSGATEFSATGASIAMIDSASNQDGCKEATVHLVFKAS